MGEIILRLAQQPSGHVRAHAEQAPSGFVRVSSILQAAVPEALRSLWHRLRCSWRYAAALRELQMLDLRTLKDIGLNRGDLHAVAYATARRGAYGRFGAVRIRRVELADLPRCVEFARFLHPEDVRLRFGRPVALADSDTFRRMFGLDDRRIETIGAFNPAGQILGLATVAWVRPRTAELALIVRSDLQRRGLGATLLAHIINNTGRAGSQLLLAQVDYENLAMRRLARSFGFELSGKTAAPAELAINR